MASIADPERLHRLLAASHSERLNPCVEASDWELALQREFDIRCIEHRFVEAERKEVVVAAANVPRDPTKFVRWFESLEQTGPGQHDPLFRWLAEEASYEQMCWFLSQEVAGEAGFEDLVALTQVKLPERAKLELARNYWDEMGQGNAEGMHGPMLARLARVLELRDSSETVWESLALGNLMVALAIDRHYAYQSIGALGVIELTAPGRARLVNAGLKRLGISGTIRQYFALHATLDVRHSAAWNAEVLEPIVQQTPEAARCIAEGALLRLRAGARCFERYRRELWSSRAKSRIPAQRVSA